MPFITGEAPFSVTLSEFKFDCFILNMGLSRPLYWFIDCWAFLEQQLQQTFDYHWTGHVFPSRINSAMVGSQIWQLVWTFLLISN